MTLLCREPAIGQFGILSSVIVGKAHVETAQNTNSLQLVTSQFCGALSSSMDVHMFLHLVGTCSLPTT